MKGLTKELKQESVEKWEEIIKNIENHVCLMDSYIGSYWSPCGFCKAATNSFDYDYEIVECGRCSLSKPLAKGGREYICNPSPSLNSLAYQALYYADNPIIPNWDKALGCAKQVLAAIKRTHIDKSVKEVK